MASEVKGWTSNNLTHGSIDSVTCYSMWPMQISDQALLAIGCVCLVISPITVSMNSFFIYALRKTDQMGSVTNKLITVMSISDVIIGSIVLPMVSAMTFLFRYGYRNCIFEFAVQYLAILFGYTSFLLLISVAIDRYLLLTKLTKYNTFMNNFRLKILVLIIFFTSNGAAIATVLIQSFYFHTATIIANILGISTVYIMYVVMLRSIKRNTASLQRNQSEKKQMMSPSSKRESKTKKQNISVAKTVKLLLGTVFLFYMPYNVLSTWWIFHRYSEDIDPGMVLNIANFASYIILFCNAIANVVVFSYGNRRLRKFVGEIFLHSKKDNESSHLTTSVNQSQMNEKSA